MWNKNTDSWQNKNKKFKIKRTWGTNERNEAEKKINKNNTNEKLYVLILSWLFATAFIAGMCVCVKGAGIILFSPVQKWSFLLFFFLFFSIHIFNTKEINLRFGYCKRKSQMRFYRIDCFGSSSQTMTMMVCDGRMVVVPSPLRILSYS